MRNLYFRCAVRLLPLLPTLFAGCDQIDQVHPLDVVAGEPVSRSIGPEGGVISIPPSLSIEFPAGSLPQSVFIPITRRASAQPFPDASGAILPGTAFNVGPSGVALAIPARVFLRVPESSLDLAAGEDLRLVLALERADGSVSISAGTYDATNGLFSAEIDEIGPLAAVITTDAIDIAQGAPPVLPGGAFTFLPFPVGPAQAPPAGPVKFASACALGGRHCFTSGLIRVWVSSEIHERYGSRLVLLNAEMNVEIEFTAFDPITDQPTAAVGRFQLSGDLQARFRNLVSRLRVTHVQATGFSLTPAETTLSTLGNEMVFGETTDDENNITFGDVIEFGVSNVGTGEMLTVRLEDDVILTERDGTETTAHIYAHVRLRR